MKERYKFLGRSGYTYVWERTDTKPGTATHKKCDVEWFWNPWRHWGFDIGHVRTLDYAQPCAVCGAGQNRHIWMDINDAGYEFNCSIKEIAK